MIGIEGSLQHFIDFKTETIEAPYISFVTKGKVHRIIPQKKDGKHHVIVVRFKSEFIADTAFQLYSFFGNNANLVFTGGPCFDRIVQIGQMMMEELKRPQPDLSVVRHLLSTLFVMIKSDRERALGNAPPETVTNTVFTNFLQTLEANFKKDLGVNFYAAQLSMTGRNLNHITNKLVHQSVSELIETRKLVEAKNLLSSTDKTISEIAFEIGYQEKSYFSKVFKKKSGQTPSEFRAEIKKLL